MRNEFEHKVQTFSFLIFRFSFKKLRLDLFLKVSRLIPRRSLAQEFCDAGLIKVNDLTAKSSREIKSGDLIEIKRRNRLTKIRVLEIPAQKQVSRERAAELFEIISEEVFQEDLLK